MFGLICCITACGGLFCGGVFVLLVWLTAVFSMAWLLSGYDARFGELLPLLIIWCGFVNSVVVYVMSPLA